MTRSAMRQPLVPKISVVIPTFNVARYVDECLASVRAQTLADWECIVVDDGSSDGTAERVLRGARDPRVRVIVQSNKGVAAARNVGLASARGSYLLFLDGDDKLHPDALRRLSAALDAHAEAAAAYGNVWAIFEDGRSYPQKPLHRRRLQSGDLLPQIIRGEIFVVVGSVMVRTQAARELGGFNVHVKLSEDWEFWCRIAARGEFRFVGTEPEVSYVRMRSGSASQVLSPVWENHLPAIRAVVGNAMLAAHFDGAEWQRLTRQMISFCLWEAGRVNFTARRYADARRLMLQSFAKHVTAKRLALFFIAQASQLLGLSLAPRLRFRDEDRGQ